MKHRSASGLSPQAGIMSGFWRQGMFWRYAVVIIVSEITGFAAGGPSYGTASKIMSWHRLPWQSGLSHVRALRSGR